MSRPGSQEHLLWGSIAQTFTPKEAKVYLDILFGMDTRGLQVQYFSDGSYRYVDRHRNWQVLDYTSPNSTFIPQAIWEPHLRGDRIRHVETAPLQRPIFFKQQGSLGISLRQASGGRTEGIESSQVPASLGERTTTHLTIRWPGYAEYRQQVEIMDAARRPITIGKFAQRIGRFVQRFVESRGGTLSQCPGWTVGVQDPRALSIGYDEIIIVGAVHVSAGTWMPLLRLPRVVMPP